MCVWLPTVPETTTLLFFSTTVAGLGASPLETVSKLFPRREPEGAASRGRLIPFGLT